MNMTMPSRPDPISVILPDGRCFQIAPPSRKAMRTAIKNDLEPGAIENPIASSARIAAQLAALVEGSDIPLETLTPSDECELLSAIIAQAGAPAQTRGRASTRPQSVAERVRTFDADTATLAVHMHCGLGVAENEPFVGSLILLSAVFDERNSRASFEAAVHDKQLKR